MHLQLCPDWSPSLASDLARFPALVKLGGGESLGEGESLTLRMCDADDRVLAVEAGPGPGAVTGPAWRKIPGQLVRLPEAVTHVQATLGSALSERVARSDARIAVLLRPVAYDLGLEDEPALWWSYRNETGDPVDAAEVLRTRILWVDGEPWRPPEGAYNGPPRLGAGQALSGSWSFDDIGRVDSGAPRRFALEVLGERGAELTYAWRPMD